MKENMFDVLMYLFENYLYDDEPQPDRASLESELHQAGFRQGEIRKAFGWMDGLAVSREHAVIAQSDRAVRILSDLERDTIDTDTQGFLIHLEQSGVIDGSLREVIIDRLMALDEEIDPELVRWVTLMVLCNQPGQEEACAWVETMLFDNPLHLLH